MRRAAATAIAMVLMAGSLTGVHWDQRGVGKNAAAMRSSTGGGLPWQPRPADSICHTYLPPPLAGAGALSRVIHFSHQ